MPRRTEPSYPRPIIGHAKLYDWEHPPLYDWEDPNLNWNSFANHLQDMGRSVMHFAGRWRQEADGSMRPVPLTLGSLATRELIPQS